jgi:hypothetical protein
MKRIVAWEFQINGRTVDIDKILPCHYLDYIWGTSTGGLIALMLGRLRMSIPQALDVYRRVGDTIFGQQQRRRLGGLNFIATKYNHANVSAVVKQITQEHCKTHPPGECIADDTLKWADIADANNDWDVCQAVCITARASGKSSQALPLRSYEYTHNPTLTSRDPNFGVQDLDLLIWEAARATSAAPFYFKMFEKKDNEGHLRRYKDGGTLLNNPAEKALSEVRDRHAIHGRRKNPAVLLSIGTGIREDTPFASVYGDEYAQSRRADIPFLQSIKERLAIAKHIIMRYTEGELIHRMIRDTVGNEHTWYKRLNVDKGLGKMGLGDWRPGMWLNPATGQKQHHPGGATLTDMENATREYLTRETLHTDNDIEWYLLPSEQLDHLAERLVRHRKARQELARNGKERGKWHRHQGQWVTGREMEPWNDDSYDGPYGYERPQQLQTQNHGHESLAMYISAQKQQEAASPSLNVSKNSIQDSAS